MEALIFEKLAAVMDRLDDIAKVRKGIDRRTGKEYSYRGLDDIINQAKPIFREERIRIKGHVLEERSETLEGKRRERLIRTVVKVEFAFVATDGTSESHTYTGEAILPSGGGQKAATMQALKTCLEVMFLIATGDDNVGVDLDGAEPALSVSEALEELRKIKDAETWSEFHHVLTHLHDDEDYQRESVADYELKFGAIDEQALEELKGGSREP